MSPCDYCLRDDSWSRIQVVSIELKNRDKSFSEVKGKAGYYVSVETASSSLRY